MHVSKSICQKRNVQRKILNAKYQNENIEREMSRGSDERDNSNFKKKVKKSKRKHGLNKQVTNE